MLTCEIFYKNSFIIENFRHKMGGGEGGGGFKEICYRYPTKIYNSTLLPAQVFHVIGMCEILLKSNHK